MKMLRAFDFECENGHKEEYFVKTDVKEVECRVCGEPAFKQLSAFSTWTEKHNGVTSDNWVKKREQKMALERKANS